MHNVVTRDSVTRMAFVKLDCGILNSTLWVEREPRDIFITALLMATPREIVEPMPQYRVNAIEETGFVVPPGWYGFVEAAGPGIVRRAMADMDLGMQALARLGEPDLESRSSEWGGRRLVRVDGGYVVLNYMRYRDKDNTAAIRQARYRQRQKEAQQTEAASRVPSSALRRNCDADVTKAEAEAEVLETTSLVDKPAASRHPPCPTAEILDLYHKHLPMLPRVEVLNATRKKAASARWREVVTDPEMNGDPRAGALDWFDWYFGHCAKSRFLTGRSKDWRADFDFLMAPTKFARVVEGVYHKETA